MAEEKSCIPIETKFNRILIKVPSTYTNFYMRTLLLIASWSCFYTSIPDVSPNNITQLQRKSLLIVKLVETDNSQDPVLQDITQELFILPVK